MPTPFIPQLSNLPIGENALKVIKIGGHLLMNEEGSFRINYIHDLLNVLKRISRETGHKIVVVVGGGYTARKYIGAARESNVNESILDTLGIMVSRLNASLLYSIYYNKAPIIPKSLEELAYLLSTNLDVIFMGGLQPGQSTTTVAALVAESTNSDLIITTNVDGIYTTDPKKDPKAKLLKRVNVSLLKKIFDKEELAGEYRMLDPLSIKIISRSKISTHIINGENPQNILDLVIEGKDIGTLIVFE